jgi:hypothetical protein
MASDEGAEGAIRRVLEALAIAGVPYMLTGSFASAFHGAPRTTQDVDIVIAPTLGSLQKLVRQFPEEEYYVSRDAALQAYGAESLFNVIDLNSGWKIDFIIRKSRPFSLEEFERRREADMLGTRLYIASAEDVILSKLEWAKMSSSERQVNDVAGILRTQGDALDLEYVERWIAALGLENQWTQAKAAAGLTRNCS